MRPRPAGEVDRQLLEQAEAAATWLQAVAHSEGADVWWPEYVATPEWSGTPPEPVDLYSGVAGIGLLLLRIARATGDPGHLDTARAAADRLVATAITDSDGVYWNHEVELSDGTILSLEREGLYSGDAGVAHALLKLHEGLDEPSYLEVAERAADRLLATASRDGGHCSWLYGLTDIIAGNAGIMLFLVDLYRATENAEYLDGARCAGDWLIDQGVAEGDGLWWPSAAGETSVYPGMSHGVAGIAYSLAVLAQETGDDAHLDAAEAGARWLEEQALCDELGCRWYHQRPDMTNSYRTGWCHGVAGTARLFLKLDSLNGSDQHADLVGEGARWLMQVTDPSLPEPQFWNTNLCCGEASVGEFFLDLYLATGRQEYLAFARRLAEHLVAQGYDDRGGRAWTNYPYPDNNNRIWFETGLKSGTAGVGWFLVRLAIVGTTLDDEPMLPDER